MAPARNGASSSSYHHRSSRLDYRDSQDHLPRRYQLPQQSFPSARYASNGRDPPPPSRRRTPPPAPPRRDYAPVRRDEPRAPVRRGPPPPVRRDYDPLPPRPQRAPIRRLADVNPFRRPVRERDPPPRRVRDVPRRVRRAPKAEKGRWLPPVRNPARYIDPPADEPVVRSRSPVGRRYPQREITPIPESRRRESITYRSPAHRSRSPIGPLVRAHSRDEFDERPHREGPRTPPEPEPEEDQASEFNHDALEEEQDVLDLVRDMFKHCYHEDKASQAERFLWLKQKMINTLNEIERLQSQAPQAYAELEEIDSTEVPNTSFQNFEPDELDYQEEQDEIKSPPPDTHE